MEFEQNLETRKFSSLRKGSEITQNFHYKPASGANEFHPAAEESLEFFFTERYLLYSTNRKNKLFSGRVHHQPYEIAQADVEKHSTELFTLEGFPQPSVKPCSRLIAKAVNVRVYPLQAHS